MVYVMNKELSTRVVGTSNALIEYINTDPFPNAETLETQVSDSSFRTSKNKLNDNRATSMISYFQMNTEKIVNGKKIFDKKNYMKELSCRDLESSDSSSLY